MVEIDSKMRLLCADGIEVMVGLGSVDSDVAGGIPVENITPDYCAVSKDPHCLRKCPCEYYFPLI